MRKISRNRWYYIYQLIVDILIVIIAYYVGFRMQRQGLFTHRNLPSEVVEILVMLSIVSGVVFSAFKTYKCGQKPYRVTMFYVLVSLVLIAFFGVVIDFIIKSSGIWRRTVVYSNLGAIPAFMVVKAINYKLHKHIIKPINAIIIGKDIDDMQDILYSFIIEKSRLYRINKLVPEDSKNLYKNIKSTRQVIISSLCDREITSKIVEYCAVNNVDCMIIPKYNDIIINGGLFSNIDDVMMLKMDIKMDIENRVIKRAMDIVISSIGLIVLSPLMIITAIIIKIQDGGNPIFAQERITRGNKVFMLYKFRSMIMNAEKDTGAVLARAGDMRITKVGKFIRLTRIDEIPQLYNVLKGEMSLVGPRPERMDFIKVNVETIPEFRYRTLVKAGVTGLAQTVGRYDTAFKNKVLFDLYYVTNYSLLLDIKILFYTLKTVVTPSIAVGVSDDGENVEQRINKKGVYIVTNGEEMEIKYENGVR